MTAVLFVLGLLVGSFLNVLIYRLPREQGFVSGRSHCPHCNAIIAWYDNLPLVSFLFLRGRCRHCDKAISLQYPIVELVSGMVFVALWHQPFFLIALELLLVIAVVDFEHFLILDSLLVVLGVLGIGYHALHHTISLSYFLTALILAGIFFALWYGSQGKWMGFGDVKLVGVLGLVFGFPGAIIAVYLAILAGGFFGGILLLLGKAHLKTHLPFGTFLSLGAAVFVFTAQPLYELFSRLFFY